MARVTTEQRARRLGREHAADGTAAWDFSGDGEARLMTTLGHIAPTTARNADRRFHLLAAYREAYDRVRADIAAGRDWRC